MKYETKLNKGRLPIVITGWQDPSQIANECVSSAELGAVSGQTDSAMEHHKFDHQQLPVRQTQSICKPANQFRQMVSTLKYLNEKSTRFS